MMNFMENFTLGEFQWSEIIYAMVGSFVGIFIPLWIDKRKEKKQEKDARQKLIAGLNSELDSIKTLIEESNSSNECEIFFFTTFVWDSIVSSGMLPDILSDKKIEGILLMHIYAELSLLKELNEEFDGIDTHGSDNAIDELREIYSEIVQKRMTAYELIAEYHTKTEKKADKRRK